jgi:GTP-binding protein
LDKKRLLAISKSDLLDQELMEGLKAEIPDELPHIFMSSVTGYNLPELKDYIWKSLQE